MLPVWKRAKELGLTSVPKWVADYGGSLDWHGRDGVRDLLRDYYDLGVRLRNAGRTLDAFQVFSHLDQLESSDRMGAAVEAAHLGLHLGYFVYVLRLCERRCNPAYLNPDLDFSQVVAYWGSCKPHHPTFVDIAARAIRGCRPFAKLIAQTKKSHEYRLPQPYRRGGAPSFIYGSKEHAKYYWNRQGEIWRSQHGLEGAFRNVYQSVLTTERKRVSTK